MIATNSSQIYKDSQDRFIKRNKSFLKNEGAAIKPVKVKTPRLPATDTAQSTDGSRKQIESLPKKASSVASKSTQNNQSQKLEELADKVSQPLLTMTTLPILELFPTTITLDLKKITVDTMTFIKSHSIQTFTYDFIREISLETGIISSSLRIVLSGQFMHPIIINHFRKADAVMAKRIILGLMQCYKQQIKSDQLDPVTDREKIITLGTAASP
jgi:hypothetical protein